MDFKQSTLGDILESEKEMVLAGAERFGRHFINSAELNHLLNEFIKSVDPDRFIFTMFLSQIRKHHTLALFSTVRLHHVQAMMDLRQSLESGACAAYAIGNIDIKDFADINEEEIMDPSKELTKKRYDWLEQRYPQASLAIKNIKQSINSSTAHANIVYAQQNFYLDEERKKFATPFFDKENDFLVKTDLWTLGLCAGNFMDIFGGINKDFEVINFSDDFITRLKELRKENESLKEELMKTENFQRAQKKFTTNTFKGE
ncbi:MAG: hypothetical protein Q8P32_00870 [Candidatus Komeilibacteria bacterium]|nr:hypothetical protein [Candidatus Komeilibacteria bacterium]